MQPHGVGCHGLVPWSFTIAATNVPDATGLSRGVSRLPLQTGSPISRCHGLVPWSFTIAATIAATVKLHGARPWHLQESRCCCSRHRETPRRKAVASLMAGFNSQRPLVCPCMNYGRAKFGLFHFYCAFGEAILANDGLAPEACAFLATSSTSAITLSMFSPRTFFTSASE
jgi:hypothetical protein